MSKTNIKPISFFFDNVGKEIKRGNTVVKVTVGNYDKLYNLQSENYTFTAIPVIHSSDNTCTACEG